MADYGAQDTSTTSLGANQFPISEAWTPNAGFSAVEGGTQSTDAGGKKSAPVRIEVKDGSDLTQGAQADAAYTSGSGSIISILKGIFGKVAGTLTISGAVTTSGTVTEANSAASKTDLDTIVTNTNKIPASPATEGGHLATIDSHIPAQGQALAAASIPVVLPALQQTALTPPAAITGFALEAGHLATIDTSTARIPAQGQALAAASTPVVLPATQITTLTPPAAITGFALEAGHIATIDTSTAASKTNLDTIVTNTNKIPASPAQEGGNLATLAGGVAASVYQINNKQVNGTTMSVNQGTIDAGTQRVAQGSAGTGTKTSVGSSATSVTILASNASRKGAMIYNDSTQVLYLDLSGGTASSSSYSLQVPSNGFFELPGPAIYSGAITGIWAAANGNARVTEFS